MSNQGDLGAVVDSLYTRGLNQESLDLLESRIAENGGTHRLHVLAARELLVLGYSAVERDSARARLRASIAHGEQAIALDSAAPDGRYITIAAGGQLALVEGSNSTGAALGGWMEGLARSLLADTDSLHAGAHNALGRLYLEISNLSTFKRLAAKLVIGGTVGRSSWEAAEVHLRRAIELDPSLNFYHLDLGLLLVERKRWAEARPVLERAIATPMETPAQEGFREEARALLRVVEKESGRPVS